MAYVVLAALISSVIFGYNLFGPWMLQIFARLYRLIPGPAALMAGRRIMADPRSSWRRIGGLGILALIAGYLGSMPFEMNSDINALMRTFADKARWDLAKGVVITLTVALLLTATAILISQASSIFERAGLTVALHRLGTPSSFHTKARWLENLGPLALVTVVGYLVGLGIAQPVLMAMEKKLGQQASEAGNVVVAAVLVGGFILAALALAATQPLQNQVLHTQRRRND